MPTPIIAIAISNRPTSNFLQNERRMSEIATYPLKFTISTSRVDASFWFTLSTNKLNIWKLDSSAKQAVGVYSTPATFTNDGVVEFNSGAFDVSQYGPQSQGPCKGFVSSWFCGFGGMGWLMVGFLRGLLLFRGGVGISTPNKNGAPNSSRPQNP